MKENEFEWRQFCKLGEAIGDGLHHEDPWISKEYKRLSKILLPETEEEKQYKKQVRKQRNENIDKQIIDKLKTDKCSCGDDLKQTRSGSKKVVCVNDNCNKNYVYKTIKK